MIPWIHSTLSTIFEIFNCEINIAKYERRKFVANLYGHTHWWSKVECEVCEDSFDLIAIHVEYTLTEFNKLHNTHIPPTLIKQIRERGIGKAQARKRGKGSGICLFVESRGKKIETVMRAGG